MKLLDFEKQLESIYNLYINAEGKEKDRLYTKLLNERKKISKQLNYWDKVLISRNSERPKSSHLIPHIFDKFSQLQGDKLTGDDLSVIGGFASINNQKIMLIAQEKSIQPGENNLTPCGVQKAIRLISLANKYNLPIVTFIDNPGTFPGFESENQGLAFAISSILRELYDSQVPTLSVVIGEGGSGGAIAFAITDYILMLEYSTFMVIAPEAASVIIYNNKEHVKEVSQKMKILAPELLELNLIDSIIEEPIGGAHWNSKVTAENIRKELKTKLNCLIKTDNNERLNNREKKYTNIGLV